jgi:HEAT repeats
VTKADAIDFLERHQPLPPDEEMSADVLRTYDEVREFFVANPDPAVTPLWLNSFGPGSGFGVYQRVEDVLLALPKALVVEPLTAALQSRHRGVRYWCAQIAASFPDSALVKPLADLLGESDFDIRYAAITALEQIDDPAVVGVLGAALAVEENEELADLLREVLAEKGAE